MLLLYPPVAKPCEPPAGIALLAGVLRHHNNTCTMADLNIEGLLFLLSTSKGAGDTWSKRAYKNLESNLLAIRTPELYTNPSRYNKTVLELNKLVETAGNSTAITGLANYQDPELSPLNSRDLLHIAENTEKCSFFPFFQKRIPELLNQSSPKHVGISINYISQAISAFALIGYVRKIAPQIKIVVGGGLITSWMSNPHWSNPFAGLIDYLIKGCGEEPLLRLMGSKVTTSTLPDYSGLPQETYLSPGFILPYSASSGCFWKKCSFCPEVAENNPYQAKPSAKVLDEIKSLKEQTNPILLHFLDNAVAPSIFTQLIEKPPGLPWYGFARVTEHLTDLKFCLQLKRSGCVLLKLGIESGSQKVLEAMNKGLEISMVSTALQNLQIAGIATYIYLLFGTPAESYLEAKKSLEFVKKHHEAITFLNLAIFNMPINSHEKVLYHTDSFSSGDLSLYSDFDHPLGWSRKEVRRFLDKEFKRQPEIGKIIRRDPSIFTSNHAPFFCSSPFAP